MGVLTETTKMKVLIALLVLTIGLGSALECYECDNEGSGSDCGPGVPGGSVTDPKKTCGAGQTFCRIKSVSGKIHQRSCSGLEDFPADYEAVNGDNTKKCKKSKADTIKECLCSTDLCNENFVAAPSTANPSTIASFTLLASL